MTVVIVDYGAGNIRSVMNMLSVIGAQARIASCGDALGGAERLILPGVGHFDHGMAQLKARGFLSPLNTLVREQNMPLLGICLGAQLIARGSEEGVCPGLGWVDADVVAFDQARMARELRVPHMGWAETWAHDQAVNTGILPRTFANTLNAQ